MHHIEFVPPDHPSLDQQHYALALGLGRAYQWTLAGKLDGEMVLDACLHSLRYETRFDTPRVNWLARILEAVGKKSALRARILQATEAEIICHDAEQLADLAFEFASDGDEAFRRLLYRLCLERKDQRAAESILALDGEAGLWHVARTIGGDPGESAGRAAYLFHSACWAIGRERAERVLNKLSHPNAQAFRDSIQRHLEAMRKYEEECMERIAESQRNKTFRRESVRTEAELSTDSGEDASFVDSETVTKKDRGFEEIVHRWTGSYALRGPRSPSDEDRVFEELDLPADPQERPAFFRDVLEALRWNDTVDVTRFAMAAYWRQPSPSVRGEAAILLRARGAAPLWLLDECRYDCDARTSAYFAGIWDYDQWRRRRAAGETTADYSIFSDE